MTEHPKMLYMGNQEKYQTVIANDEDHESELVEQGWCEYHNLEEVQPNLVDGLDGFASGNGVIEGLENEVSFLKDELIKAEHQNSILTQKLRLKELEDLKVDELQKILTEKEISFNVRDGKPVLIDLIVKSEQPEGL